MPKSSARGASTSRKLKVEVLGLTPHALWLSIGGREHMLDYTRFPWFQKATIEDVQRVELRFGHLHWPTLDVDLHIDSLTTPEQFPLTSRQ
jgi:hypothetical protein